MVIRRHIQSSAARHARLGAKNPKIPAEGTTPTHTGQVQQERRVEDPGLRSAATERQHQLTTQGGQPLQPVGFGITVDGSKKLAEHVNETLRQRRPGEIRLPAERLAAAVKALELPKPGKAPRPEILAKAIENKLGWRQASVLSSLEVARVLGAPEWHQAIAELGPPCCLETLAPQPNFLLAAHLAKWMDSIKYSSATLDDVAASFLAANPEVKVRFPHLDGKLIAHLQDIYEFMPGWSFSPGQSEALPGTGWETVLAPNPAKSDLDKVLTLLTEVPLAMRLTSGLADRLKPQQPFKNANVVMVQHTLGQASPFVDAMIQCGMDPKLAEYVGIPYQQNPAVKAAVEDGQGVKFTVPQQGDIEDMYRVVGESIDRAYQRHLENGEPILILDDGGYASKYILEKYRDKQHLFTVVEQTTRGLTEISKLEGVEFPILNVAGSYGKRFESAQVGDAVKMAVRRVLDAVTTTPTRKDVLIVGAGKVGEGVADSFAGDGARITIYDPYITPGRKKELEKKGYNVVTDKAQALDKKFLVVGCSGHRSIDMADFLSMSSPVFLASASSKKVEIDTLGLGELATDKEGKLRKILAAKINEQETFHYWLRDGRIVTALADGLPVNFQGVNSIAPELIDHTMSLMLLGAAQAMGARGKQKHLVDLEPTAQFWLQAQMEGIRDLTMGPPLEIHVQFGEWKYTGTRADWMRIATSPATPPEVLHLLFEQLTAKDPMDPIALAILSSRHELSDKTLDAVLDTRIIPYAARLLQNELLTDAQEDRIIDWLTKTYDISAWGERGETEVAKHQAVAVLGDADTGWHYHWPDVVTQEGRQYLAFRITTTRDAVVDQLADALLLHPRCPAGLRLNLLTETWRIASTPQVSTVLSLQNPAWKTEELDRMLPELVHAASNSFQNGKRVGANYAYDVIECMRDHPSASDALRERCEQILAELRQRAVDKGFRLRGQAGWEVHPSLGFRAPDYSEG